MCDLKYIFVAYQAQTNLSEAVFLSERGLNKDLLLRSWTGLLTVRDTLSRHCVPVTKIMLLQSDDGVCWRFPEKYHFEALEAEALVRAKIIWDRRRKQIESRSDPSDRLALVRLQTRFGRSTMSKSVRVAYIAGGNHYEQYFDTVLEAARFAMSCLTESSAVVCNIEQLGNLVWCSASDESVKDQLARLQVLVKPT